MATTFLINSAYTIASGTGSLIKNIAPSLAIGYVVRRVFSSDSAFQERMALAKTGSALREKIIEMTVRSQIAEEEIQKIEHEIKLMEGTELNKTFASKIKNIFKFAIKCLFPWTFFIENQKKGELKNQLQQLKDKDAQIKQSGSELENRLNEICQRDAELNNEISIQTTKQAITSLLIVIVILPNLESIIGGISTLLGSSTPPPPLMTKGNSSLDSGNGSECSLRLP